jgi:hypothetical protein
MRDPPLALKPANKPQAKNITPAANNVAKRHAPGNRASVKIARLQFVG